MKYEFSVPMPANKEGIAKLADINNKVRKSSITSLYYALPGSCVDNTGFEQLRTVENTITKFNDYIELIEFTKKSGFDFIYLLNSPKPFLYESRYFKIQLEKLDKL